jgi:hypothetical protein
MSCPNCSQSVLETADSSVPGIAVGAREALPGCAQALQKGPHDGRGGRRIVGLAGRHFCRQCVRYEAEGIDGLRDKRLGRVSHRRAPESELERTRRLYREEYSDFTAKHFHKELRQDHNYTLGYTVTRLPLQ